MFGQQTGAVRGVIVRSGVAIVAVAAVALGYACAPASAAWRPRPDFNLITHEDLVSTHYHDTYDAVEALHSNWLITRPNSFRAQSEVLVYMDNIRLGGVAEMQNIPLTSVEYVRYFDPSEATTRWGIGHTQGVIYVSTHPEDSASSPGMN